MKIGIDARALQGETQFRGIGKALESLLTALPRHLDKSDKCVFYVDSGLPKPKLLGLFPNCKIILVKGSPVGRMRYVRSVLQSYPAIKPKRKDVDVLLQYDATLGIPLNVPTVCIFYDLIPYIFREEEKKMNAESLRKLKNKLASSLYWKKYLRVLDQYSRAKKIISISESSRKDLLKFNTSINPSDIITIHMAAKSVEPGQTSPGLNKFSSKPYILYIGGIDLRKNVLGLLKAFYDLKPEFPDLRLITVGKEFSLDNHLGDLGWTKFLKSNSTYAKDVITPGFLSDSDTHYLYEHAEAFIFPSRYEGFGMPPLEAMHSGCPVIAYNNSSIPEVVGSAALLLEDGEPLSPAIRKLLSDEKLKNKLVALGKRQAKRFSWDKNAAETLKVLRDVAKDSKRLR